MRDIILIKIGWYLWRDRMYRISVEYHRKYRLTTEHEISARNEKGCYLTYDYSNLLKGCRKYCAGCTNCLKNAYATRIESTYNVYNYRDFEAISEVNSRNEHLKDSIGDIYVYSNHSELDSQGRNKVCFKAVAILPKNYAYSGTTFSSNT